MIPTAVVLLMATAVTHSSWLEVRTDGACSAGDLAEQIAERIVGERNPTLRVEVDLRKEARAIAAALSIFRGGERVGQKALLAPTCAEAVAAVTAVVALAVSHPTGLRAPPAAGDEVDSRPERSHAGATPQPAPGLARPGPAEPRLPQKIESSRRPHIEGDTASPHPVRHPLEVRFVGAAGVDVGTLADPGPVLGGGARAAAAWGELRGLVWYGLPSTREEVSLVSERTRADFLALSLDYCRGLDKARWLGLCGGLETSLKRTSRSVRADEHESEEDRLDPTFGPLLSATFAYRAARWVPEVDLSMRLPLLEAAGHARPGFRAAFGAALPF